MNFKYSKQDKLKSKKLIEQLFTEGKSVTAYPLKLIYLKTEFEDFGYSEMIKPNNFQYFIFNK